MRGGHAERASPPTRHDPISHAVSNHDCILRTGAGPVRSRKNAPAFPLPSRRVAVWLHAVRRACAALARRAMAAFAACAMICLFKNPLIPPSIAARRRLASRCSSRLRGPGPPRDGRLRRMRHDLPFQKRPRIPPSFAARRTQGYDACGMAFDLRRPRRQHSSNPRLCLTVWLLRRRRLYRLWQSARPTGRNKADVCTAHIPSGICHAQTPRLRAGSPFAKTTAKPKGRPAAKSCRAQAQGPGRLLLRVSQRRQRM